MTNVSKETPTILVLGMGNPFLQLFTELFSEKIGLSTDANPLDSVMHPHTRESISKINVVGVLIVLSSSDDWDTTAPTELSAVCAYLHELYPGIVVQFAGDDFVEAFPTIPAEFESDFVDLTEWGLVQPLAKITNLLKKKLSRFF
jgi:hypothetical protein